MISSDRHTTGLRLAAAMALLWACNGDNDGGANGSGGRTGATGGSGSGGASLGPGGSPSTGGSGGSPSATGGAASATGGRIATGGVTGGGAGGTSVGSGGATGAGGVPQAGRAGQTGGQTGGGGILASGTGGGTTRDGGQGGVTGAGGQVAIDGGSTTGPTLPPITDYSAKGPFATKVETNVGPNNAYVVFRPDPLGKDGFLHAPIIFGPGITQTVQPTHTTMLTNFASHGFVVVGTPVLTEGPGGANNRKSLQDGLDWIVKQHTTAGSIYQGKLYADHAISMGFSVGGTSAVEVGGSPSVITVVSIHGHTATAALHGTLFQTTGTLDTVGDDLQQATFESSKVPTFLATLTDAKHQYIETAGGGEERKAIVAWLRYWIYNDTGARNFFFGNDCVLCKAPWQNPQRKNWTP